MRDNLKIYILLLTAAAAVSFASSCSSAGGKSVDGPQKCAANEECPGGYKCASYKECVKLCRPGFPDDCAMGSVCLESELFCVECTNDSLCGTGYSCVNYRCRQNENDFDAAEETDAADTESAFCFGDSDCKGGQKCGPEHLCVKLCRPGNPDDCANGFVCLESELYCVECINDSLCPWGYFCDSAHKCSPKPLDGDWTEYDYAEETLAEEETAIEEETAEDEEEEPSEEDVPLEYDIADEDEFDSAEPDMMEEDKREEENSNICVPFEKYCFEDNTYRVCNAAGDGWDNMISCNQLTQNACLKSVCDVYNDGCSQQYAEQGTSCNDGNISSYPDVCDGWGTCGKGLMGAKIELYWASATADLDIHLTRPNGAYDPNTIRDESNSADCNWYNCNTKDGTTPTNIPKWGNPSDDNDDPRLNHDSNAGGAGETIVLPRFGDVGDYVIWYRYYDGGTPANEALRIKITIFETQVYYFDRVTKAANTFERVAIIKVFSPTEVQVVPFCETSCGTGQYCSAHGCDASCASSCGYNNQCRGGICQQDCRILTSCPSGTTCDQISGVCKSGSSTQCPPSCQTGQYCDANTQFKCVTCTQIWAECDYNAECCPGNVCCPNLTSQTQVCCASGKCDPFYGCVQ